MVYQPKREDGVQMRLLIAYSPDFSDYDYLRTKLNALTMLQRKVIVVSGSSDFPGKHLGERWAFEKTVRWEVERHYLSWFEGVEEWHEALVKVSDTGVFFWNGWDGYTEHLIGLSRYYEIRVKVYLV